MDVCSLGCSARALQRQLNGAGTSYRRILELARGELAEVYQNAGLPQAEIALLLGFEEINSLRRFLATRKAASNENRIR